MHVNHNTPNDIVEYIEQLHLLNSKDTHLDLCALSEEAASRLATNLPIWVTSISFGPELPAVTAYAFLQNLPSEKKILYKRADVVGDKRSGDIKQKEPELKRKRKAPEQLPDLHAQGFSFFASISDDFQALISLSQLNKSYYMKSYFRLLQLSDHKNFHKQRQLLGLFIKDAFRFIEISGIESAFIDYKKREDIPADNRILALACLVIISILKNDNETFQNLLVELYVFAAAEPDLFKILCGYIHLYKGEYDKCRSLLVTDRSISESMYDSEYEYLDPQDNLGWMLSTDSKAVNERLKKLEDTFDENNDDYVGFIKRLRHFPALEKQFLRICSQKVIAQQQNNQNGRENKILLFPLLEYITKNTADDFAELCFSLNYFSLAVQNNHFMDDENIVSVVGLFSQTNKKKVLGQLLIGLEEMLKNSNFTFSRDSCSYNDSSVNDRLRNYLAIIEVLSSKTLVGLLEKNLAAFLEDRFDGDTFRRLRFAIFGYLEFDVYDLPVKELWLVYKKISAPPFAGAPRSMDATTDITYIIAQNYVKFGYLAIDWKKIKATLFSGILRILDNPALWAKDGENFFYPLEQDFIVALSNLCSQNHIVVADESKIIIFDRLFSHSQTQDDAELLIMLLRCCFENEEELKKFLNKLVWNDRKSDKSKLSLLKAPAVIQKSRAARVVLALAPFLEQVLVEELFNAIDLRIKETIDVPADDTEWPVFLEVLTNLVFYISANYRASYFTNLSQKQYKEMYQGEDDFPFTIQTCRLLRKNLELHAVARVSVVQLLAPFRSVESSDFIDVKFNELKSLLALLYEKNNEYDDEIIFDFYCSQHDLQTRRVGSLISHLLELKEKTPEQRSQMLTGFKESTDHFIESHKHSVEHSNLRQHKEVFANVSGALTQGIMLISQATYACLTNNPLALKRVLKQIHELSPETQSMLRFELQKTLERLKDEKFVWSERIKEVLRDSNLIASETRPAMVIG